MTTVLVVLLIIAVGVGVGYVNYLNAKKRREAFAAFAAQQGFSYQPAEPRAGEPVGRCAVPDR